MTQICLLSAPNFNTQLYLYTYQSNFDQYFWTLALLLHWRISSCRNWPILVIFAIPWPKHIYICVPQKRILFYLIYFRKATVLGICFYLCFFLLSFGFIFPCHRLSLHFIPDVMFGLVNICLFKLCIKQLPLFCWCTTLLEGHFAMLLLLYSYLLFLFVSFSNCILLLLVTTHQTQL